MNELLTVSVIGSPPVVSTLGLSRAARVLRGWWCGFLKVNLGEEWGYWELMLFMLLKYFIF